MGLSMAMLIPLDTLDNKDLTALLKAGGRLLTLEGKHYLRIDEISYYYAIEDEEDDDD
jgi:hypothetical protein